MTGWLSFEALCVTNGFAILWLRRHLRAVDMAGACSILHGRPFITEANVIYLH